jgi:heme-degrading monooxygenase HmoA
VAEQDQPKFIRIWRGRTRRAVADEYEAYNYEEGIKPLIEAAQGVQTFRSDSEHETRFITVSYWSSLDEMMRFSKGAATDVHHLERDAEYLIELPRSVEVFELRHSHGQVG